MGFLDEALGKAVPGGNLSKPLMIAAAALLASRMFGSHSAPQSAPQQAAPEDEAGGLIGGLGGLIDKFRSAGAGDVIDSWVGAGQNKPIQPSQLQNVLGGTTISDLARRAGINEQDLLAQLSQALPGLVDGLTPQGRLPTEQEVRGGYRR